MSSQVGLAMLVLFSIVAFNLYWSGRYKALVHWKNLPAGRPHPWIVSLVVLFAGGLFYAFEKLDYALAQETGRWPVVPGALIKTWSKLNSHGTQCYYCEYSYCVGDKRFCSSQIRAHTTVSHFPIDKRQILTVHYNPKDPSEAVLETRAAVNDKSAEMLFCLIFAGLLFVIGFGSDRSAQKSH